MVAPHEASSEETKKCLDCSMDIPATARKCPYCQEWQTPEKRTVIDPTPVVIVKPRKKSQPHLVLALVGLVFLMFGFAYVTEWINQSPEGNRVQTAEEQLIKYAQSHIEKPDRFEFVTTNVLPNGRIVLRYRVSTGNALSDVKSISAGVDERGNIIQVRTE